MGDLSVLPNIGKELERQLNQAGIFSVYDLTEVGSREAWLRIKGFDASACYNRLCALEGAIQNIRWHNLDDEIKQELKTFYTTHK